MTIDIDIDIATSESSKFSHNLRLSPMHIKVLSAKVVCCIWLLTSQTNFRIQLNSVDTYHIDLGSRFLLQRRFKRPADDTQQATYSVEYCMFVLNLLIKFKEFYYSLCRFSKFTLKAPITTVADDNAVHNFGKNVILLEQTILMKYHALFVIFEKSSKIRNCRLLQIIGGVLWVKTLPYVIKN